jgi:Xaa-Pro aminopeptidase
MLVGLAVWADWNIGTRVGDDALVTAKGCELMTRGVPAKADKIEALMAG